MQFFGLQFKHEIESDYVLKVSCFLYICETSLVLYCLTLCHPDSALVFFVGKRCFGPQIGEPEEYQLLGQWRPGFFSLTTILHCLHTSQITLRVFINGALLCLVRDTGKTTMCSSPNMTRSALNCPAWGHMPMKLRCRYAALSCGDVLKPSDLMHKNDRKVLGSIIKQDCSRSFFVFSTVSASEVSSITDNFYICI